MHKFLIMCWNSVNIFRASEVTCITLLKLTDEFLLLNIFMWWLVDPSLTNQLLNENSLCKVLSIWIISWSYHAKWPIINVWLLVTSAPNRTKSYQSCIPCSLEISRHPAKIWTWITSNPRFPFYSTILFVDGGGGVGCWSFIVCNNFSSRRAG